MGVFTTAPSCAPQRFALCASFVCTLASGGTNLVYGWQRGVDLPASVIWASVSLAVSIIFALSWPALIASLDRRQWGRVFIVLAALLLTGTYSVSAALGSAMGGRENAAAAEKAATGDRKRAQDAYDTAKADLAKLSTARSVGEVETLLATARPICRVVVTTGSRDTVCSKPPTLEAELARARQRAKREGEMATASADLKKLGSARVANADAQVLATYATAIGWKVDADHLNKLLVLLAVLVIECGGGMALAVGIALAERPTTVQLAANDSEQATLAEATGPSARPLPAPLAPRPPAVDPRLPSHRPLAGLPEAVVGWLAANGGRAGSVRCIANAVGRPPSSVGDAVRRLANDRRVVVARGAGGRTTIELAPIGNLN